MIASALGSSPLARGLLPRSGQYHFRHGIIPARAGFTRRPPSSAASQRDHPRSRGVYSVWPTPSRSCAGSSPLARGLHLHAHGPPAHEWIIPARAGFTTSAGGPAPRRRDHPRSRGVYPPGPPRRSRPTGSSPLARGLRGGGVDDLLGPGIIPARAGFTGDRAPGGCGAPDHPRSRGVYGRTASTST